MGVGVGVGVALVPRMASTRRTAVVLRELAEDRPVRHVIAAVRRGAETASAVSRLLNALRAEASPTYPEEVGLP